LLELAHRRSSSERYPRGDGLFSRDAADHERHHFAQRLSAVLASQRPPKIREARYGSTHGRLVSEPTTAASEPCGCIITNARVAEQEPAFLFHESGRRASQRNRYLLEAAFYRKHQPVVIEQCTTPLKRCRRRFVSFEKSEECALEAPAVLGRKTRTIGGAVEHAQIRPEDGVALSLICAGRNPIGC
jgi:hypothetical protein